MADGEIMRRCPAECKYLGRIILDGPTNARPHKGALQAMIETIEKNAPAKNKRRLRFEIQTIRPVVPDARGRADRQTKDTFVALDCNGKSSGKAGEDTEEIFRVNFADIVSIGSWRRSFVFITLDQTPDDAAVPSDAEQAYVRVGKFYVQAFRFGTANEAAAASQNLIKAVEQSRIKDMQIFLKNRMSKNNGWTQVKSEDRAAVEKETGRNPLQSPLPEEVPEHVADAAKNGGSDGPYADRPTFCSPLPPAGAGVEAKRRERTDIQRTLDSHDLSPQGDAPEPAATEMVRAGHSRPSRGRAAELQLQFGAALTEASSTDSDEPAESESGSEASPQAALHPRLSALSDAIVQQPAVGVQVVQSTDEGADFNLVEQDHAAPVSRPVVTVDNHSPEHLRLTRLKSPAESGYQSSPGSAVGSHTSLLSANSDEADQGLLTPSPLVKRSSSGSKSAKAAANRKLLGEASEAQAMSIV